MQTAPKIIQFAIVLFLLAAAFSCSDDEEEPREPLIIGTWSLESQEITNIVADAPVIGSRDVTSLLDEYRDVAIFPEDATITFNEDRTYTVDTPDGDDVLGGSWELSEDEETITISGLEEAQALLGTSSLPFAIQSIDATNFSLLASVSDIRIPDGFDTSEIPFDISDVTISADYQLDLQK